MKSIRLSDYTLYSVALFLRRQRDRTPGRRLENEGHQPELPAPLVPEADVAAPGPLQLRGHRPDHAALVGVHPRAPDPAQVRAVPAAHAREQDGY